MAQQHNIDREPNVALELPYEQFLTYRIQALASRLNRQALIDKHGSREKARRAAGWSPQACKILTWRARISARRGI